VNAPVTFRCRATDRRGRTVTSLVRAADRREAARLAAAEGLTPVSIEAVAGSRARMGGGGALKPAERIAVARALALMIGAGVDLLEAMETAAGAAPSPRAGAAMAGAVAALKSGAGFAQALEDNLPGFPAYALAMARAGEATGRLSEVLGDAAAQMEFEDRLGRDVVNALIYPLFLLAAGCAAVLFIFTQVVPKFAVLIGEDRGGLPLVSRWVLGAGEAVGGHPVAAMAGLLGTAAAVVAVTGHPPMRRGAYALARRLPLTGPLLAAREVATWARLTAFALAHGIDLLQAAALARGSTPPGAFHAGLEQYERDLRAGVAIDVALGRNTDLKPADLSLLRAGQKSGALPKMFAFLADHYEGRLRDALKRLTVLIEPLAVGAISILVGVVALSMILALSSVYDRVQ